jgi:hypothetical protein
MLEIINRPMLEILLGAPPRDPAHAGCAVGGAQSVGAHGGLVGEHLTDNLCATWRPEQIKSVRDRRRPAGEGTRYINRYVNASIAPVRLP